MNGAGAAAHAALLAAVRAQVAADPELADFMDGALAGELPFTAPEPRAHPVMRLLPEALEHGTPETRGLIRAVLDAAPHLHWRNSYSPAQLGQDFLDRSGWFRLVSPEGPFRCASHQVSIGYWDRGLYYPRHWHEPEEIYLVLAGGARFAGEGYAPQRLGPGGTRAHASWQPHAAAMQETPLLALALWRGAGLLDTSVLDPAESGRP
ncbi:hypothetical protein LNKW23_12400 [Paralimibaculum aggregatum]|uniref:Uncharacterized protein n=1 Tax=Paralimibaculum aggregatum TaxID=3036245 RepID=A0ABQ6LK26_9RHOB|nr:dimethylsulfonioproprionate lyase family protein [Limibaculum sp. NKW23]GMG82027.1 hypothetical protein LNKW23_12400 [Limibaculum sp. NKW23]